MRNHGLKVLGLALLSALGMMAFIAAGAQAQTHTELLTAHTNHNKAGGTLNPSPLASPATNTPGTFLVNLGAALLATVSVAQVGEGVLLVAGRSLEIRCTTLTLNEGKINTSTDASGKATFTGCKSFDHKTLTELKECLLKTLETIEAKALVLPILHGGENFLLFEPQGAEPFTTVSYKPGIGCTLPLNNPVTGAVVALVEELDAVVQTILFSEGIQLLTGDVLSFGASPSYITAKGTVQLSGPHLTEPVLLKLGIH